METVCTVGGEVLTSEEGVRLQSAVFDSELGIGPLCERCYEHVKHCKQAGDAMISSAITMEDDRMRSYFDEPEYVEGLRSWANDCYSAGLKFYLDAFDPDERY